MELFEPCRNNRSYKKMSVYSIDTETQGLNTQAFLMGVIQPRKGKALHFDNKEEMKKTLLAIEERHKQKGECALFYAHNMHYDYLAIYGTEQPKHHHTYSTEPYIIDAKTETGTIYAKYLSTTSLWYGDLASMGDALGEPKTETPEWLKQEEHYNASVTEWRQAHAYMEQDAKIVVRFIETLRQELLADGIKPRWIITGSQIGISNLMKHLRKQPNKEAFLKIEGYDARMHLTRYPDLIHQAMRGGRVQALGTGYYSNTTKIDINSHYPHCMTLIRTPDLRTEQLVTEEELKKWNINELLQYIGILSCTIRITKNHPYGILPIRISDTETEYPRYKNQILTGTWTHEEIQKAIEYGWTIQKTYWSIIWQETTNPFKQYVEEGYERKKNATDEIRKHLAKLYLNGCIGKLGQRREEYKYEWANCEEEEKRRKEGWIGIEVDGINRLYAKNIGINYPSYYAPILNALITAKARIMLLESLKTLNSALYLDTDAIVSYTEDIEKQSFIYGKNLGEWKTENKNSVIHIYGKKTYKIDDDIHISGISKRWINKENYEKGTIEYRRLISEKMTSQKERVGQFTKEQRNLHETLEKTKQTNKELQQTKTFVDSKWTPAEEYTHYSPSPSPS